jgi:hypothetical protein
LSDAPRSEKAVSPLPPAHLAGILILLALLFSCAAGGNAVSVKGRVFSAEIARTPRQLADGLMFRKEIGRDACMIFLHDADGYHSVWMKNCLVCLDVVWVNGLGVVVEIEQNVPPCPADAADCPSYGGRVPSRHFVEFAAGTVSDLGIQPGDQIGWNLSLPGEGRWKQP